MTLPRNLCYTIVLDTPGNDVHRQMARLLVTSLLRTRWHGRIVVFRNGARPVLAEGHRDLEEIVLDAQPDAQWWRTMGWKYLLRDQIDLSGIGKVLFLDCDCIALRSINHLMLGSWDIYTAPEPGRVVEFPFNGYLSESELVTCRELHGLNSGTMGVRASRFLEVMAEWERIDALEQLRPSKCRDQHSWNRLILDTSLRHRHFSSGEVQFPFLNNAIYPDYRRAALVHAAGRTSSEKLSLLYGLWMQTFAADRLEEFTSIEQAATSAL
ncbi:MAG: hypothetical protein JWL90_33 [Chthoniobacteraceae bacterium]|nr:hypothetical protein [Chthoniobacteraceae bacterium]